MDIAWSVAEHVFKLTAWGTLATGFSIVVYKNNPNHVWLPMVLGFVWFIAFLSAYTKLTNGILNMFSSASNNIALRIVIELIGGISIFIIADFILYPAMFDIFSTAISTVFNEKSH